MGNQLFPHVSNYPEKSSVSDTQYLVNVRYVKEGSCLAVC
jgi:hypothetical protein